jgi:peroxiredoxin
MIAAGQSLEIKFVASSENGSMSLHTTTVLRQEIGAPVPDFQLTTINGKRVSLHAALNLKRGAVVVFWSSVCSHCARYDGYFNSFSFQYPELTLIAVASREKETVEQLRAAAAERRLTFPILCDPGSLVANQWFTQQTPRVFLIDINRVLRYRGAIDNFKYSGDPEYVPYLRPAIQQFLTGKAISRPETASFGCAVQSVYYNLPKVL